MLCVYFYNCDATSCSKLHNNSKEYIWVSPLLHLIPFIPSCLSVHSVLSVVPVCLYCLLSLVLLVYYLEITIIRRTTAWVICSNVK